MKKNRSVSVPAKNRRDSEFDNGLSCTSFAESGRIRSWEDVQQFRKLYEEMKKQ
ncbi:MAG: hypothetical protein WAV76_12675 [Bacteroidota bacterium]